MVNALQTRLKVFYYVGLNNANNESVHGVHHLLVTLKVPDLLAKPRIYLLHLRIRIPPLDIHLSAYAYQVHLLEIVLLVVHQMVRVAQSTVRDYYVLVVAEPVLCTVNQLQELQRLLDSLPLGFGKGLGFQEQLRVAED